MGCGISTTSAEIENEINIGKTLPPIRPDILTDVGVGAFVPLKDKYDNDVYNAEKSNLLEPIMYCHLCRKTGIYYNGRLFIDNNDDFNNKIKYICWFHIEKKNASKLLF